MRSSASGSKCSSSTDDRSGANPPAPPRSGGRRPRPCVRSRRSVVDALNEVPGERRASPAIPTPADQVPAGAPRVIGGGVVDHRASIERPLPTPSQPCPERGPRPACASRRTARRRRGQVSTPAVSSSSSSMRTSPSRARAVAGRKRHRAASPDRVRSCSRAWRRSQTAQKLCRAGRCGRRRHTASAPGRRRRRIATPSVAARRDARHRRRRERQRPECRGTRVTKPAAVGRPTGIRLPAR